jgi:hypothetical protein
MSQRNSFRRVSGKPHDSVSTPHAIYRDVAGANPSRQEEPKHEVTHSGRRSGNGGHLVVRDEGAHDHVHGEGASPVPSASVRAGWDRAPCAVSPYGTHQSFSAIPADGIHSRHQELGLNRLVGSGSVQGPAPNLHLTDRAAAACGLLTPSASRAPRASALVVCPISQVLRTLAR